MENLSVSRTLLASLLVLLLMEHELHAYLLAT
jgi:hypothetical protein